MTRFRSGIHRRQFISTDECDHDHLESFTLVTPIERLTRFDGHFIVTRTGWHTGFKPKTRVKLIIALVVALVIISAISGYFLGMSEAKRRFYEPPDPVVPPPPSWSKLHVFKRGAVCTDAPQCSDIGRTGRFKTAREGAERSVVLRHSARPATHYKNPLATKRGEHSYNKIPSDNISRNLRILISKQTKENMSEAFFDEYDYYNFDHDKHIFSGHSGKQRTKREVSEHTNHNDPSGHSRKIVTKLRNTEANKKPVHKQ